MKQEKYVHWQVFVRAHDIGDVSDLCRDIIRELLPHGSGINYKWWFDTLKNGKLVFHNAYDGMNENGFYCHIVNFSVTFHIQDSSLIMERVRLTFGDREHNCCCYDIRNYLEETIGYTIQLDTIL